MDKNKKLLCKIVSIISICALSENAHGMMRRFSPRVVKMAPFLHVAQRTLLPGQEKAQPWIEINKKIEEFKFQHGLTAPTQEENVKERERYKENTAVLVKSGIFQPLADKRFQHIINMALQKHGIDPASIDCYQGLDHGGLMAVGFDFSLYVNFEQIPQDFDDAAIMAIVEHEISHLLHNDSGWSAKLKKLKKGADVDKQFDLLIEQRADTHSALQSPLNAKFTQAIVGYSATVKNSAIREWFVQKGKKQEIACMNDDQLAKYVEKLRKDRSLNDQDIQELELLLNQNSYAKDLVTYMEKQRSYASKVDSWNGEDDFVIIDTALKLQRFKLQKNLQKIKMLMANLDSKKESDKDLGILLKDTEKEIKRLSEAISGNEKCKKISKNLYGFMGGAAICVAAIKYIEKNMKSIDVVDQVEIIPTLEFEKGWFGMKPTASKVWDAIELNTQGKVNRQDYGFEYVDAGLVWKCEFTKKSSCLNNI